MRNALCGMTEALLRDGIPPADVKAALLLLGWTQADADASIALYAPPPPPPAVADPDPYIETMTRLLAVLRTPTARCFLEQRLAEYRQRRKGATPWPS